LSSRGRHTIFSRDWSSDVCSSDLVRVGVIDTGVDGNHPDIAPNFDKDLSRNFTVDMPTDPNGEVVDGPCEFRGCVDPNDHDDNRSEERRVGNGRRWQRPLAAASET